MGGVASGYILYAGSNNNWQLWTGPGGFNVVAGPPVSLNTWTHLVGTYDGTTARLYVNGTWPTPRLSATSGTPPVRSGWRAATTDGAANYFLPGRVDEVAVYASALSAARVSAHFTAAG